MSSQPQIRYAFYCGAIIDLMGQSERLQQAESAFVQDPASTIARELVSKTTADLTWVRRIIRESIEAFNSLQPPPSKWMSAADRHHLTNTSQGTIRVVSVSDSIFVYTPVATESGHINSKSLFGVMTVACGVLLEAFRRGIPLRGGIDAGLGIELPGDTHGSTELYGNIVARAHHLESHVAKWMRIVVGDGALRVLQSIREQSVTSRNGEIDARNAQMVLDVLFEDEDKQVALDYLGPKVMPYVTADGNYEKILADGLTWLQGEEASFRAAGDTDKASKYANTLRYLKARLPNRPNGAQVAIDS